MALTFLSAHLLGHPLKERMARYPYQMAHPSPETAIGILLVIANAKTTNPEITISRNTTCKIRLAMALPPVLRPPATLPHHDAAPVGTDYLGHFYGGKTLDGGSLFHRNGGASLD